MASSSLLAPLRLLLAMSVWLAKWPELGGAVRQGTSPYHLCDLHPSIGSTSGKRQLWSTPSQVRLSVTGVPGEMVVSWVSPARLLAMGVRYGRQEKSMNDVIENRHIHVSRYILPQYRHLGHRRGKKSPYIYHATLRDLQPSTRYFYKIFAGGDTGDKHYPTKTKVFSFNTPPKSSNHPAGLGSSSSSSSVSFIFLADHGTKPNSVTTLAAMQTYVKYAGNNVDLFLHGGDTSYANGKDHIWDAWGMMLESLTGYFPYMVVAGNHELVPGDSGHENGSPLLHRFRMPYPNRRPLLPDSTYEGNAFWYSFDWGPVHFVAISTEHDDDAAQMAWLRNDLHAARNNSSTEWIVTFAHAPIYTSNSRHGNKTTLRSWLSPLLDECKVDLSLWGHDHSYERLFPLYNGRVTGKTYSRVNGTVHVICGSAGWDLHNCWEPTEMSAFHSAKTWGFLSVKIVNSTYLRIEFINSEDLSVVDSVAVHREPRHVVEAAGDDLQNPSDLEPAPSMGATTTVCPADLNATTSTSTAGGSAAASSGSQTLHSAASTSSPTIRPTPSMSAGSETGTATASAGGSVRGNGTPGVEDESPPSGNSTHWWTVSKTTVYHRLLLLAWPVGGGVLVLLVCMGLRSWCCPPRPDEGKTFVSDTNQRLLDSDASGEEESCEDSA